MIIIRGLLEEESAGSVKILSHPVKTFLAIGLAIARVPTVLLTVPLEHLVLDLGLYRFAFLRDCPVECKNFIYRIFNRAVFSLTASQMT